MTLYVFSATGFDSWSVINDNGFLACEFDYDEIALLNRFCPVRGFVSGNPVELAVMTRKRSSLGIIYLLRVTDDKLFMSNDEQFHCMNNNFLIFEDEIALSSVLPKLIYGVSAVVTDQGSLIWSDMHKDCRIRLSDICTRIMQNSLTNDAPVYVLDDKLSSISPNACRSGFGRNYRFDVSELTDERLLKHWNRLRQYIYVSEVYGGG